MKKLIFLLLPIIVALTSCEMDNEDVSHVTYKTVSLAGYHFDNDSTLNTAFIEQGGYIYIFSRGEEIKPLKIYNTHDTVKTVVIMILLAVMMFIVGLALGMGGNI